MRSIFDIRRSPVALALALVLGSGCGSHAAAPDLKVILVVVPAAPSGDASHPLVVTAKALNVGTHPAWHVAPCATGSGIWFRFYGPDGAEVPVRDPIGPVITCGDSQLAIPPGGAASAEFKFTGTLYTNSYDPALHTYQAKPGTYTVVASLDYGSRVDDLASAHTTRSATFTWGP